MLCAGPCVLLSGGRKHHYTCSSVWAVCVPQVARVVVCHFRVDAQWELCAGAVCGARRVAAVGAGGEAAGPVGGAVQDRRRGRGPQGRRLLRLRGALSRNYATTQSDWATLRSSCLQLPPVLVLVMSHCLNS